MISFKNYFLNETPYSPHRIAGEYLWNGNRLLVATNTLGHDDLITNELNKRILGLLGHNDDANNNGTNQIVTIKHFRNSMIELYRQNQLYLQGITISQWVGPGTPV